MGELAIRGSAGEIPPSTPMSPAGWSIGEIWEMACWAAKSGIFPGAKTPEAAVTLMLLCQADKLHPIEAVRRFHVIHGRPTMRADAIQATFQESGGKIELVKRGDDEARAFFSHPTYHPKPVEFSWTIEDAKKAKVYEANENYKKYPAAMNWARLISLAVTTIAPGIKIGIYTPEEVQDMAASEDVERAEARQALTPPARHAAAKAEAEAKVAGSDGPVYGWEESGVDDRPYTQVVRNAVEALNRATAGSDLAEVKQPELHGALISRAINTGVCDPPASKKGADVVKALTTLYHVNKAWVRAEINAFCRSRQELAGPAPGAPPADDPEDGDDLDDLPDEPGMNG